MRELTKRRLRKSPTSFVVDGPPMLRNTTAVGPLDFFASPVELDDTDARLRLLNWKCCADRGPTTCRELLLSHCSDVLAFILPLIEVEEMKVEDCWRVVKE